MWEIVSELGWRPVSKDSPAGENMMADYKHLQTFRQFMDSKQAIQGKTWRIIHNYRSGLVGLQMVYVIESKYNWMGSQYYFTQTGMIQTNKTEMKVFKLFPLIIF